MGSLLVHRVAGAVRRRLYLSGDPLTGDHLDQISERHPEIDTAVAHLGGTRILGGFNWSSQHLDRGGVDGQAGGVDAGVDGQGANEVAGHAVAAA